MKSATSSKAAAMKPGSGGGTTQNAKAQSRVKQAYGKTFPAKKPGMSGDTPRKGTALASKKKK